VTAGRDYRWAHVPAGGDVPVGPPGELRARRLSPWSPCGRLLLAGPPRAGRRCRAAWCRRAACAAGRGRSGRRLRVVPGEALLAGLARRPAPGRPARRAGHQVLGPG
jgi:hypothetical protein